MKPSSDDPSRRTHLKAGLKVLSKSGKIEGKTTGATRHCTLGGCGGLRLYVRWPDNSLTYPCTKGMSYDEAEKSWRIE